VAQFPCSDPSLPATEATRQSFLERVRVMDPNGWEELYRRYRLMIISRALQAGLGSADADDVVQNVFAAVARNPPGPSPWPGAFRSWLCEQARWRILDKHREMGRQVGESAIAAAGKAGPVLGAAASNGKVSGLESMPAQDEFARHWDEEFARHVTEVALRRVAAETSAEHVQMYQLLEEQGWKVREVARQFRVTMASVYVVRHRVGTKLKKHAAEILRQLDEKGLASELATTQASEKPGVASPKKG
jgi:RNA polymerase sigma-70 factor (ECF subfamily)